MSDKIFVKDLAQNQSILSTFLVKEKGLLVGKNGKPYMALVLSDRSGSVDARVWDNIELLQNKFEAGDVIRIKGNVQLFQNRLQLILHKLDRVESPENLDEFISQSSRDPEELYQELKAVVATVEDRHVRELLENTLADTEIRPLLLNAPAAKTIHHARRGGLLEHILSICAILDFLAGHYKMVDRSLLIFGAIYHDLGKIWELEYDKGVSYTTEGRLIGHLTMGVELVEKKASQIMGFPQDLKIHLKHIVLSHHGKLEYGSPKRPKTLEAFLVSFIDDLDSKMDAIVEFMKNDTMVGDSWTRYSPLFDRYFLTSAQLRQDETSL